MVSGTVELTLAESKCYNCIKVNFLGSARVHWSGMIRSFTSQEIYIQESLQLWNPKQSHCGSIGPGFFSFQFQFVIPSNVPSSFAFRLNGTSTLGYVLYKVEARAVTGAFQHDLKATTEVLVSKTISISGTNQAVPVRQVKQKEVGCLCCAAGNVEFVAKLPRSGYCVTNQDVIPLTVDVLNNSTRVVEIRASLIQRVTLSVRNYHHVSNKIVAEVSSEIIRPGASNIWSPTDWIIPPGLWPTLLGCRIIQTDYILEVSAVISNAPDLSCCISLLMGNQPFVSSVGIEDQW